MSFVLNHPVASPTLTVTIPRGPEIGDIQRETTNRVLNRNRHGDLRGVKDTAWPFITIFQYTFRTITETIRDEIRQFLKQTTALEINIVDHNSISRDGVIISDSIEFVVVRDVCSYDFSFQFRIS